MTTMILMSCDIPLFKFILTHNSSQNLSLFLRVTQMSKNQIMMDKREPKNYFAIEERIQSGRSLNVRPKSRAQPGARERGKRPLRINRNILENVFHF